MARQYKVFLTPLISLNTYDDEVEITDLVKIDGLGALIRGFDGSDYDIGLYTFGDLTIKALNKNGYFSDPNLDSRSVFKWGRDQSKVRVVFSNDTDTITFRGLINDDATREDGVTERITFRVLSQDAVLKMNSVSGGTIDDGDLVSLAMFTILNQTGITKVLSIDQADIVPGLDFEIDDASELDNLSVRDAMSQLLQASNSVMLIENGNEVVVRTRGHREHEDILELHGPYDEHRRENIIDLFEYNTGRHRAFTSVRINNTVATNTPHAEDFGFRQKKFTFDFVTDPTTITTIAETLLDEFDTPKIETRVKLQTALAKDFDLLDVVSINYPLRWQKFKGSQFAPIIGVTEIGETTEPLPSTYGSIKIDRAVGFKITEIEEDPTSFTTTLRLRQLGKDLDDGMINAPGNCIVGFAVIGEGIICEGDTDPYNPATIGGAVIGFTEVA